MTVREDYCYFLCAMLFVGKRCIITHLVRTFLLKHFKWVTWTKALGGGGGVYKRVLRHITGLFHYAHVMKISKLMLSNSGPRPVWQSLGECPPLLCCIVVCLRCEWVCSSEFSLRRSLCTLTTVLIKRHGRRVLVNMETKRQYSDVFSGLLKEQTDLIREIKA